MPPSKPTASTEGTRRSARVDTATKNAAPSKRLMEDSEGDEAVQKSAAKKKAKTVAKGKKETSSAGLQIGDTLPEITLKNEKEEDVNVKELAEKGLVMFVVPKADTPGCTNQACAFRDAYSDFTNEAYAVYGLSNDKSAAQAKWQTKKELPYPLLSDPTRAFISAIGAGSTTKTTRSHFIFEKGTGRLIDKKVPVSAKESSKLALEFIHSLKSNVGEE